MTEETQVNVPKNEVEQSVTSSVEKLILLTTVEEAYQEQSGTWFTDLADRVELHIDNYEEFFRAYERVYKEKSKKKAMPTTYRSAKSVIVNALKNGVPLTDPSTGDLRGKTALESAIKESRNKSPSAPSDYEKLMGQVIGFQRMVDRGPDLIDIEVTALLKELETAVSKVEALKAPF